MRSRFWLIAAVLGAAVFAGCEKPDESAPKAATTEAPAAATRPATSEPATQPSPSSLLIDGKPYAFPPARLRVSKADGHVIARLYTNDPKAALGDDYKGNGFDLMMKLDDITEPTEVYTSVWQFKAPSADFVESPYGIFLEGIRYQLQPGDVSAQFLGDVLQVRVHLTGKFLQFDQTDAHQPAKSVYVEGYLPTPVEYKD